MLEFDSELYFRVAFFAFLIPLGSGVCIDLDLGLENERISDGNIIASSAKNASTPAKNGRLNYTLGSSWCAGTSDTNPYLQIDLQTLHIICAVSTQGNSQADQWVKTYKLQFSIDGTTWTDYKEVGQVKFFMGNDDRNSVVKHVVYRLLTRYLRFLPQTHQGGVCMRAEVFGGKQKPENLALGKATSQSSTFNKTGDNVYGVSGNAVDGNSDTNFLKGSCSHTQKDNPSWWRVDLGSNLVDVSEVHIVNRFSQHVVTKYYEITFGSSPNVASNTLCEGLYDFHNFTASAVCFTKPLKTGRYVGILTTQEENLQLCEVEVYSRENLAFQKPTYHHTRSVDNGTSDKAVDGNSNMIFADGSCTFGAGDQFPWWRVDLGQDEFVTEVYIVNIQGKTRLGKFEIRVGTVSSITDISMTSPKCGRAATHHVPTGESLSFFCRPSLKGRYVTIRDLRNGPSGFNLCEVEVYSEQRACHSQAIGVTSSDAIPDGSLSASSFFSDGRKPSVGRLNKDSWGWLAQTNINPADFLQIDLLYDYVICAVATQGAAGANQWVTKYKIQLSLNDTTFNIYRENNTEKVFNGNSGRNDIVKHGLREYALARFIRFVPTDYHVYKALRVEVYGVLLSTVPSQAPGNFTVTATSSTSIRASWTSLPEYARHGTITGYKLFYRQKGSVGNLVMESVAGEATLTKDFTSLNKYTKYEFQVLAVGSRGEGPKSSVKVEQTLEDAPTIPSNLSQSEIMPDKQVGPKIKLTWYKPAEENGIIRSYTVFYSHNEDPHNIHNKTLKQNVFSYTVDVLGGAIYQFHVRAATIKPGPNATLSVAVNDYEPGVAPKDVSFSILNQTTFNISWSPLTRKESYSKVISYEVKTSSVSSGSRQKRSPTNSKTVNTTKAFVILYDIQPCSNVYVRAYTKAGPGPYGQPLPLELNVPKAPNNLRATDSQSTKMILEWERPQPAMGEKWKVEYSGKKSYNNSFSHEGSKDVQGTTKYTLDNLVPGTKYDLRVYGISKCGNNGSPSSLVVETKIGEPLTPVVPSLTTRKVAESRAEIELWPAEQRNGPISAYQVIVLRVVDGVEELPADYKSQLDGSNKDGLSFYVAAEIENSPAYEKSWKFTIGDGNSYGRFVNKELKRGDDYIVYQRAITEGNSYVYGEVSKVAKISVEAVVGENEKSEGSGPNAAAIAVPVVLLLLLIPAVVVAVFFYRRRKQSRQESDKHEFSVTLNDVQNSPVPGSTGAVYENLNFRAGQEQQQDAVDASPPDDEELVYSQPEDGKPKPIPVNEFPSYYKQKSENGAIVLRDEFKQFPGGMQASWNVGKNNRAKNRYGNITTYDHSRVVLEKIEGDPTSDYINASYIPTYDEKTMCYIATQGPNNVTLNDFWRMIWQENCSTIVMLTNLVELGKTKCEQYWPESNSKLGAITVTLHKTAVFADYIIRTFLLVKDSEKREVQQYHYLTWPDRGVPARSSALLGFRYKIHTRHQATGGPLVVHCSAGVGRTGTYIAIDAMLEGAKKIKTVFISNYVQVMRRSRPHMVQKDDQYVFLHQAVVEALTCGNTEIAPQDLRISINKLSRAASPSKNTGFGAEFKRLQFVTDCLSSEEETTTASQPSNIDKNRFPNILPLDTARVRLMSTQPDHDYINASFVDDYKERNAYILTQAPLDNTIGDFWRMTSQYNIGTVVMLNNLKEGKQNYPQYWPGLGSARHGAITVQLLSENTSNNITSRRFSIINNEPPQKTTTVQHINFTGWVNGDSCPDSKEIIDLLTAVQQSQQQSGNGAIVFQCSDGIGRSGCVASIMSVIERVKIEQTVDVFQTIKLIRAKRPGAVNTLDRYVFCYKTILAYLDSFNAYSNFADC